MKGFVLVKHLTLNILLNVSKIKKLYLIVECMMEIVAIIPNLEGRVFGMN
jgi:hypothetical protein